MNIEPIQNGVVIDHIEAGRAMQLYKLLNLGSLDASVALIKNVPSKKMGKKDIIKIDADIDLDFDVIGFVDPSATVDIISNGAEDILRICRSLIQAECRKVSSRYSRPSSTLRTCRSSSA